MLHQTPPAGYVLRSVKYGPYSPSRLIVARCPHRFFGQYIRKDRAVTATVNAARGNAIHHALSKITASLQNGEKITPKGVELLVQEAVGLFPAAYEQIDLVRGAANAYLSNPSPYLNAGTSCEAEFAVAFYEEESFVDDAIPNKCYVPVPYTVDGYPNPQAMFGGKLDQISVDEAAKIVTILDHKSTPSKSRNEDHDFQIGAYAWLASLFYPGYTIRTVLHYCHPDLNCYAPPEYWTPEELQEYESYIHSRIGAVESFQEFPALPGAGCDYCHMKQECPINLALMEQKARGPVNMNVSGFDDLVRLAGNVHTLGKLYDELNKALKEGVELYAPQGGVSVNGYTYKFKVSDESVDWTSTDRKIREDSERASRLLETSSHSMTPEELAEYKRQAANTELSSLLNKHGVDPDHCKEWQSAKLKNLWKTGKEALLNELTTYVVKDRTTRWGGYKG